MASTSSSPLSLVLLRPLPCRSLLLSKHRKPFPTPRTGRLAASAAAGAQQRLLRPPETGRWSRSSRSGRDFACLSYNNPPPPSDKDSNEWPILRRWDVPWEWQTVVLSMVGCGVSFALTGLVEQSILQYVGFSAAGATIDEKAEILFLGQLSVTAVVLGVIFSITNTFRPFPDDVFRYDVKEPFKLQNGWLLWAGIGLFGAVISIALVGAAMTYLNGAPPEREKDSLVLLLPLIGSSTLSTAYLVGITGVLAPILEETVFRGFLMVSLTKWFPTPVCVILSAAVFAFAHLTPDQFPQLFVLGVALGFTYAQTRNLLAPITIHAFWNSGVILLLTFLQLQGYDIKELLGTS
ncbi:membrane-embedded CAAX protease MroQ-like [Triticum urartu]|uniref:CAAX prenyl protease 2/Lysostaphin resistance protein A-like domain-containing protein n=1 Tax=Triticum urartu TaxID=4572 RepID=A0A8R7QCV8_TRIUA|nr:membrane-embedded CAAX protease MroQ-like [Triticum urartu]